MTENTCGDCKNVIQLAFGLVCNNCLFESRQGPRFFGQVGVRSDSPACRNFKPSEGAALAEIREAIEEEAT